MNQKETIAALKEAKLFVRVAPNQNPREIIQELDEICEGLLLQPEVYASGYTRIRK